MMRALNTAGTGMIAQQTNLDVLANNLANVNTTGFKGQRAEFQDLIYQTYRASGSTLGGTFQTPQATQVGLGVRFAASATSFDQGGMLNTGNATDMAINGEGFFKVALPDGTFAYTRDGAFNADANGLLVNKDGYPLEPAITVPPGSTSVTIALDGTITATVPGNDQPQTLGNLTLTTFTNPPGLTRIGQNLYRPGGASGEATDVTPGTQGAGIVAQRFLEGSNVQIVEEMVRMITAQRAYEINSKAITTADEMLGILNNLKR